MKYWREIIIVLLLALLAAMFVKANRYKVRSTTNYEALTDAVRHYENRLGAQSASIKTIQFTNDELKVTLLKKNDTLAQLTKEFAKLRSVVSIGSKTKLPEIGLKLSELVLQQPCDSILPYLRIGNVAEKWYRFNYEITQDSLKLAEFTIPNTISVITGVKRTWFLGKQTVNTDVTQSNPYVYTDNLRAAEVVITEPWYKKWYLWLAAGVAGGLILK